MLDKQGELIALGKHQKPLSELEPELSRLKREIAEVRMERDFVKKCVTYFAKELLQIDMFWVAALDAYTMLSADDLLRVAGFDEDGLTGGD